MAGHVACVKYIRIAYKILAETPDGNRPFGRPGCRREDNIKFNPKETGSVTECCGLCNEILGSTKLGNIVASSATSSFSETVFRTISRAVPPQCLQPFVTATP